MSAEQDAAAEDANSRTAAAGGSAPASIPTEAEEATTPEVPPEVDDNNTGSAGRQDYLLDRLLYKGVLPRYAFPTDVATFYVFDENRSTYNRPAFRFSPSQGLAIALTQYAPGKEVWIAGKKFQSNAIYSPYRDERYGAWQQRRFYFECRNCHYAATEDTNAAQKNDVRSCPACGQEATFGPARSWFRPPGFAHPIAYQEDVAPDDRAARSYATRAKLAAPTPEASHKSWRKVSEGLHVHYLRQRLLVTNTGPRQEGYSYCTLCGMIEPTFGDMGGLARSHRKPYPDLKEALCPGGRTATGVVLGTDFYTDILLVSIRVNEPVRLLPGALATDIALRTVSEALAIAACRVLDLEPGEVQADYRAALTSDGQSGREAEIYLYDTLPGGAGFTRSVGQEAARVFARALEVVSACDCDTSCYKCLRSFKNKFEHDRLDRHAAADLLKLALTGVEPRLSDSRSTRATTLLVEDVRRQAGDDLTVTTDATLEVAGIGTVEVPIIASDTRGRKAVVAVTHSLTPHAPSNDGVEQLAEFGAIPVLYISELMIRRNLPMATREVLGNFGLTG